MLALPVKAVEALARTLEVIGLCVMAFMTLTICYDATMRYFFAAPTSWSLEVNSFLVVYLAIMMAAGVQQRGEHIAITLWPDKAGPRARKAMAVVTALVGAAFCAILVWRGSLMTYDAYIYSERVSSAFGTPTFIPYAMLPIGFATLGLQFLINLFREPPEREEGSAVV